MKNLRKISMLFLAFVLLFIVAGNTLAITSQQAEPGVLINPGSDLVFIKEENTRFHSSYWQYGANYSFSKDSSDGLFRVYYETSNLSSYATNILTHLSTAKTQLNSLGYATQVPYGVTATNPYEIYVMSSASLGSMGRAVGKNNTNGQTYAPKPSQLHIRNNLSSSGTYSLKYVVWHEYFHAIQYAYGAYPSESNSFAWMEATAEAFAYKMGSTAYTRGHDELVADINKMPFRQFDDAYYGLCSYALEIGDTAVRKSWENIASAKSAKSVDNINNALSGQLLTSYGNFATKLYTPKTFCVDKSNWSSSHIPTKVSIVVPTTSGTQATGTSTKALYQLGAAYFKITTTSSTSRTLTITMPSGVTGYYIKGSTITKISGTTATVTAFKSGIEVGVVLFNASMPSSQTSPTSITSSNVWVRASAA